MAVYRGFPMAGFEITRIVDAPVEQVFGVFTDLDRMGNHCKDIVKIERVTNGPIAAGTVFKETRSVFGRESTETLTFKEFDPPSHWVISGDFCGMIFLTNFNLQPEGDGTRLIVRTTVKATNPIAWLMGLISPLFMGSMKRAMKRDTDILCSVADGTWTEPDTEQDSDQDEAT